MFAIIAAEPKPLVLDTRMGLNSKIRGSLRVATLMVWRIATFANPFINVA